MVREKGLGEREGTRTCNRSKTRLCSIRHHSIRVGLIPPMSRYYKQEVLSIEQQEQNKSSSISFNGVYSKSRPNYYKKIRYWPIFFHTCFKIDFSLLKVAETIKNCYTSTYFFNLRIMKPSQP